MEPKIIAIQEKRLAGKSMRMSLVNDKTGLLWQSFMPLRKNISNIQGNDLFSVRVYDSPDYFQKLDVSREFVKQAAAEVSDWNNLPAAIETFILPAGLYAVFMYKGKPSEAASFFDYIFTGWLPSSNYTLDDRPHFEILGEKYKNEHPDSEEEVWIPVRHKHESS